MGGQGFDLTKYFKQIQYVSVNQKMKYNHEKKEVFFFYFEKSTF